MLIQAGRMIYALALLLVAILLNLSAQTTNISEPLVEKDVKENKAIIQYLGHSGWAIKTQNHILIFDYVGQNEESLSKVINPAEVNRKKVLVFVSHDHPDHYSSAIFNWSKSINDINYILGWKLEMGSRCLCLGPREKKSLDGLDIWTIKSTDEGVGFLVKVDGLVIFHGGDHACWGGSIDSFSGEIDYLVRVEDKIDIVFLALAAGNGQRSESITRGIFYAVEKLRPKVMFPMHAGGKEYLYKEFAQEAEKKNLKTKVCYCLNRGDELIYQNGEIKKGRSKMG